MQPQYAVSQAVVAAGASPARRRPSVRWQFTAAALLVVGAVLVLLSTAVLGAIGGGWIGEFASGDPSTMRA